MKYVLAIAALGIGFVAGVEATQYFYELDDNRQARRVLEAGYHYEVSGECEVTRIEK